MACDVGFDGFALLVDAARRGAAGCGAGWRAAAAGRGGQSRRSRACARPSRRRSRIRFACARSRRRRSRKPSARSSTRRCSSDAGLTERAHRQGGQRPRRTPRRAAAAAPGVQRASRHRVSRRHQRRGQARRGDAARPRHRRRLPRPRGRCSRSRGRWSRRNLQTPGTITFVGTVGEEGLGDLRGVKYLFREGMKGQIDRFVSIDGTGLGITHIAVGSLRYRVTFKGPGGHSYGAFGMVNPIHALGRAMARIADFEVPRDPKTTFNVGRIGGGTSVNAIPFEAWAEVDMRSADPAALQVARREISQGDRRCGGRREHAVGKPAADRGQGARRRSPRGPHAGRRRRLSWRRCR